MCVSGHRSESSIRSYASKAANDIKLAMSEKLSSALCGKPDDSLPLQDMQASLNKMPQAYLWYVGVPN